jgi:glycosyltransferase involved in cell wall biosynthesis
MIRGKSRRYLVVTPCRDEGEFIQITIDSVLAQTIRPNKWVIVDDGSTDETPHIVASAAAKHSFINVIKREDRGSRAVGGGVVEAFNEGVQAVDLDEYEYICKLDGDLGLPPRYFETLIERMEADPLLGNMSGKTYIPVRGNRWVSERMGDENAIGASKFYRMACFKEIGGFVKHACWDGIDGHICRMRNWIAGSVDDEDLRIKHYRPQGSSQNNVWTGRLRWGRGKYFMGSSPIYVLAASVFRIFEYPFLVGGIGILFGYISAMLQGVPRYSDPEYLKFLRHYEFMSLIRGKRKTLEMYNRRIREEAKGSRDPRSSIGAAALQNE